MISFTSQSVLFSYDLCIKCSELRSCMHNYVTIKNEFYTGINGIGKSIVCGRESHPPLLISACLDVTDGEVVHYILLNNVALS